MKVRELAYNRLEAYPSTPSKPLLLLAKPKDCLGTLELPTVTLSVRAVLSFDRAQTIGNTEGTTAATGSTVMRRSANPGVRRADIDDHSGESLAPNSNCHVVAALGIGDRHIPRHGCLREWIGTISFFREEVLHFGVNRGPGNLNRMD